MSSAASPALPAFSYAQAAKGLAPSAPASSASKEESPEQNSKQPTSTENTTAVASSRSSRSRPRSEKDSLDVAKTDGVIGTAPSDDSADKENLPPAGHSQLHSDANHNPVSVTASSESSAQISSPRDKEFALQQTERKDSWDKGSQTSTSADKSTQTADKDKVKDSEDDWEKVSVPSVSAEKELKAAPQPVVNFWKQRQEIQEAKMRELAGQRPVASPTATTASKPKTVGDDSRRKSGNKDAQEKENAVSSKRGNDGNRANDRKEAPSAHTSRPASQQGEKSDTANPPLVADAKFWPTPETANVDERRKSTVHEKNDKPDAKGNGSKGHGNKWVPVPFVPTAKFETQLPPAAARRGGRAGGRARDGSGRGGHSSIAEKNDGAGSMGPPPLPKQSTDHDRGRKPEGNRGGRASSVPTGAGRPTSGGSVSATPRKPPTPVGKDQSTTQAAGDSNVSLQDVPTAREQPVQSNRQPRSPAQHEGTGVGDTASDEDFVGQVPSNALQAVNAEDPSKQAYGYDRAKTTAATVPRTNGDVPRERGPPRSRDWTRERSDAAREKVESWRDRETTGEPSNRREQRPERGRGGYRGRGNHSYTSFSGSHAYTSPLPQNGFEAPKPATSNETRPRETSQPFPMQTAPPPAANRNTPRSHSIPLGVMYPGYYNAAQGVPGVISPIQTDMTGYGYPSQMSMQPGIMSAMPYHDPLNSYAVMSMVMTQVEYYFSIDNLCKDLFLRKHMDSQGFVPLNVIANFKRIKTLTEDNMPLDVLRGVCQQVKTVEYLPGDDGEDRLRRRDGWRDFVLPMEDRFSSAQHDGPTVSQYPQRAPSMPPLPTEATSFSPIQARSPTADMAAVNGMFTATSPLPFVPIPALDGQPADRGFAMPMPPLSHEPSRRESTTSPPTQDPTSIRSPPMGQRFSSNSGLVNGHHRQTSRNLQDESVFPDESIPSINICMRDPSQHTELGNNPAFPGISRVLSNESSASGRDVSTGNGSARVSGLRGGAASPEQLARLQGMTFGSSSLQSFSAESPVFFTKDGQQTQMPPVQPGHFYETYQSLHETAMQQREHGIDGALEPMYSFWSNFLVDKFNPGMYQEFKSLTAEDAKDQIDSGTQHLMHYYQNILRAGLPMPEVVAVDVVELLHSEQGDNKPMFKMLRKAWRDGALNLKTRKRLGTYLTDAEKAEFDKGG